MKKFRKEFIALASNAPEIPDSVLVIAFQNGLQPKIRAGVKLMEPRGLEKIMNVAELVDEWSGEGDSSEKGEGDSSEKGDGAEGKLGRNSSGRFQAQGPKSNHQGGMGGGQNRPKPNTNTTKSPNGGGQKPHNRLKPPFRHLTPEEVAKWKAEGLYFRCDEKYKYNHRCARPELLVLMLLEEGTEIYISECSVELEEATVEEEGEVAEISISSMMGISSSKTIKFMGTIHGEEVVVLIDSGATHNFVSTEVMKKLNLPIDSAKAYNVFTAGWITIRGAGSCPDVRLELQGCSITSSFLPIELGSVDVILGIQWLETLGDTKVNWKLQVLKFKLGNTKYKLTGDPSLCCSQISAKAMRKTMEREGEVMLVEYYGLQVEKPVVKGTLAPQLTTLLNTYAPVFEEPKKLPPSRGKEHAIVLKPDAQPVSMRPFRYPQVQKEEIEKQVATMLTAGIIQGSSSPFWSPVLLVRKKDGSWRFCVDYRALNKATVADCYPILMIDQLLDELQGAVVFSKLNLKAWYHQILVKASDVPKTAFRTHDGHYEFLVIPFGMSNAPATFQSLMTMSFGVTCENSCWSSLTTSSCIVRRWRNTRSTSGWCWRCYNNTSSTLTRTNASLVAPLWSI